MNGDESSWNIPHVTGELDATTSTTKRRKRKPLNCWHCRIRKIKCDRGSPCSGCLKSGDAATCSYITQSTDKDDHSAPNPGIEARINRLESLVRSVASTKNGLSNGPHALSPPDSTDGADSPEMHKLSASIGSMKVDPETDRTYYLGPSHWVSMLSEIHEIKEYISCEVKIIEKQAWNNFMYLSQAHVSLLRGLTPAPTREELLTWMPPRIVADMAVNKFFTSTAPTIALLHAPTFREQCAQHWADPSKTPLAWMAMFCGVMYASEVTTEMDDHWVSGSQVAPGSETKNLYRMLTLKYLLASNYTRPSTFTLEAMLLLLGSDYMTSSDAIDDTTLMLSVMVRSAVKMGLHRSYPHPDLTPFRREMRRRLWIMIHSMDIMHATQVSLPPNIHQDDVDLTPPSNLYDSDFGPTSTSLPPSRPLTEITPISFYLLKYKHCLALDKLIKFTESNPTPTRDQMKPYEDLLLDVQHSIPAKLQTDFANDTLADTALLRLQRMNLDRLSQFNICILYRRFLARAHQDQKLFHYRRSCIDAAMRILAAQHDIYSRQKAAAFPDAVRKRHLLTLTSVDFYTAGMAVAMDLYHGIKAEPAAPKATDVKIWGFDRRPDMIDALERTTGYWALAREESVEAAKAWAVYGFVLEKVRSVLVGGGDSGRAGDGGTTAATSDGATGKRQQNLSTPVGSNIGDGGSDEVPLDLLGGGDFDWGFLDGFNGFTDDVPDVFQF